MVREKNAKNVFSHISLWFSIFPWVFFSEIWSVVTLHFDLACISFACETDTIMATLDLTGRTHLHLLIGRDNPHYGQWIPPTTHLCAIWICNFCWYWSTASWSNIQKHPKNPGFLAVPQSSYHIYHSNQQISSTDLNSSTLIWVLTSFTTIKSL